MTTNRTELTPEIRDDVEQGRYELLVDGEVASFVDYHRSTGRLLIARTVTVPAHRGRGHAGRLVRHVLDEARRDGLSVMTTCWYVRDWLDAHPEYRDLD